jgi:hypothetical protein
MRLTAGEAVAIIYVHGVNVRDPSHGKQLEAPFRRWLAPRLSSQPDSVQYTPVFWGDIAATFRWKLASRPETKLLRQGGDDGVEPAALRLASWNQYAGAPARPRGPVLNDAGGVAGDVMIMPRLIPPDRRADFLSDLYLAVKCPRIGQDPLAEVAALGSLADVAQTVAQRWDDLVGKEADAVRAASILVQAMEASLPQGALLAQGGLRDFGTRTGEVLKRLAMLPFDAVSTALAELRPAANEFVARFLGDVLTYIQQREVGGEPGEIPKRVLSALRLAHERKTGTGEPIVVVTHSMGGQLVHDALAYFAPRQGLADVKVDYWFSCGAQVSFFAELALLRGQPDPAPTEKLPRPANVLAWRNYYDPNDLVGFVMAPVFEGVTDEEYDTGYGLALAHTGYLGRPSFFEKMANRIDRK